VFEAAERTFIVAPRVGGRIATYSWQRHDVLAGRDTSADHWGSTFWTSPQSDWGWPPPRAIDPAPYAVTDTRDGLTLSSDSAPELGVRVHKRFRMRATDGAVRIRYTIENLREKPLRLAPWEVTRVRAGGVTLFPRPPGTPETPLPGFSRTDGVEWF